MTLSLKETNEVIILIYFMEEKNKKQLLNISITGQTGSVFESYINNESGKINYYIERNSMIPFLKIPQNKILKENIEIYEKTKKLDEYLSKFLKIKKEIQNEFIIVFNVKNIVFTKELNQENYDYYRNLYDIKICHKSMLEGNFLTHYKFKNIWKKISCGYIYIYQNENEKVMKERNIYKKIKKNFQLIERKSNILFEGKKIFIENKNIGYYDKKKDIFVINFKLKKYKQIMPEYFLKFFEKVEYSERLKEYAKKNDVYYVNIGDFIVDKFLWEKNIIKEKVC